MAQHHGWSIDELEEMYPYERMIYVEMLVNHLEKLRMEAEARGG